MGRRIIRRRPSEAAQQYAESTKAAPEETPDPPQDLIVSTGSTLLNLAIFGGRLRGGGIPGGIIVEVFGEAQLGKTAVLAEICGCAQSAGGQVKFADPEARLDREYAEIYGVNLPEDNYWRPDLVSEVFDDIKEWDPPNKNVVSVYGCDSLAALSSKLEMEKGDKMGMKIAKDMSAGLRKTGRIIAQDGYKCIVCTNQLRHGDSGSYTPGGKGVPFWATVRIHLVAMYKKKYGRDHLIEQEITLDSGRKVTKVTTEQLIFQSFSDLVLMMYVLTFSGIRI
jgi:RecA/RadA recombinase